MHRPALRFVPILLAATATLSAQDPGASFDAALAEANRLAAGGSLQQAAEGLQGLVPQAATDAERRALVGGLTRVAEPLHHRGAYQKALPAWQAALGLVRTIHNGDHQDVAILLGRTAKTLSILGREQEALPLLTEALAMRRRLRDDGQTAQALDQLGLCLQAQGRAHEALPLYEEGHAIRRRLHAGDDPGLAQSLNNIGYCRQELGEIGRALEQFQQALAMSRRLDRGDQDTTVIFLRNVAFCLRQQGQARQALPLLEEALAMQQRLRPGDQPGTAAAMTGLADALEHTGRANDALARYEEALAMLRRLFNGDHPRTAEAMMNCGTCLMTLSRFHDALPRLRAALAMTQSVFAEGHPMVAHAMSSVAQCLANLDRFDEALPIQQDVLARRRKLHPGDHPHVATAINNVAATMKEMGRHQEALAGFQDALAMHRRLQPGDSPGAALQLNNIAAVLGDLWRNGEALPLLEQVVAMRTRMQGERSVDVAVAEGNLGKCLGDLGRHGEALPHFHRSLELVRAAFPGDHELTAMYLNNIAASLDDLGRPQEAMPLHQQSLQMFMRVFPGDHSNVAMGLSNLGGCLEQLGRADEAIARHEKALAIRRRLHKGDHPTVASALNALGFCLRSAERFGEALPLFEEALSMHERIRKVDHQVVALALHNLAACLASLERWEEAEQRDQQALAMYERLGLGDDAEIASTLNAIAFAHIRNGRAGEAVPVMQRALDLHLQTLPADHPQVAQARNNLAFGLLAAGRIDDAIPVLQQAVQVVEELRWQARALDPESRASYFAHLRRGGFHQFLAALYARKGEVMPSLRWTERGRARGLLDLLQQSSFDPLAEVDRRAALRGERETRDRVVSVRKELERADAAIDGLHHTAGRLAAVQDSEERQRRLSALNRELADAYSKRREAMAERSQLCADVLPAAEPLDAESIRALVGEGELLIYYSLGVYHRVFVVPPQPAPVTVVHLPDWDKAAEAQLESWLLQISGGARADQRGRPAGGEPAASAEAGEGLARRLLPGDLWQRITACRRVWLIPDGDLFRLPFESLVMGRREGKPVHWIDAGPPIAYVPSASVLQWVQRRAAQQRQLAAPMPLDLVALGDPTFTTEAAFTPPERGVLVTTVNQGGEGSRIGLAPLDVLQLYDGRELLDDQTLRDLRRQVEDAIEAGGRPRAPVKVRWWRRGKELEAEVAPGALGITVGRGGARAAYDAGFGVDLALLSQTLERTGNLAAFGGLPPLPGTRVEVNAAAGAFPAARVLRLCGAEATEANLYAQAPKATFLHLATHGLFEELAGSSFSALALTVPAQPTAADDGFLKLEDLLTRWRDHLSGCRMVVLSACRTGVGKGPVGDEAVHALPVGFLYAGASSVIASLWNVNDASTAELMADFYRRLAAGGDADRLAAFHEARRALRQKHPEPRHWAPFLFLGSPR